jgi:hypothetical protein
MRIEAVTVCVGYSDFLGQTAKHNRHIFDRWVVVTHPDDKPTIECCKVHNLHALTSAEFSGPGKFNKGRAIALGMNQLATDGWICHLDGDVVLPRDTRRQFELACLDPTCLYGVDRVCLHSWDEWQQLESSDYLHAQHGHHLVSLFPPVGEMGCRIVRGRFGYVPIGYMQLWHGGEGVHSGMRWKDYQDTDDDAAHSDIKFALQWDRGKRVLIPEVIAVHLESERVPYGTNWKGRRTKPFGPDPHRNPDPGPPYCERGPVT